MKIHYASDIHLEFARYDDPMPEGDVLILAGDICVARFLQHHCNEERARKHKKAVREFFNRALDHFGHVVYLAGNHEPYGMGIEEAWGEIAKFIPPAVHMLENDSINLRSDVILVGTTLWSDMDRGDPLTMALVEGGMNDFSWIDNFRASDAIRRHTTALNYIREVAKSNPDKTIIVATHHAPSYDGINPKHVTSRINGGYASDLSNLILAYPNIIHWVHGHTHIRKRYQIGQCRVYANCRGYLGYEHIARDFSLEPSFEV